MKKVLFVATVVKTHIMSFHIPYLEMFKNKGYETHVCARNDYKNKEDCIIPYCDKYYDIPFERSPFNSNNIVAYKQLKKIIDSNEYDIIHCHTPVGGVLTRLAAKKVRKNGTKVIYTAHGFHFCKGASLKSWLLFYPIESVFARYTDVLITINKEDYKIAQKFKAKSVRYVPGVGVKIKKFGKSSKDRENKRKELGISNERKVVLSIGELIERKNHETALKAIAKLDSKDILYLICGGGELEDYLRGLSKKLGIEDVVRFLGFRKDIPEICMASDLFLFPSYQEGLPVSIIEAMASGLPIVCSSIRGNTDLIENGKGGYLLEPDDVNGFVGAIKKIIQNITLREDMGVYNKESIVKFDIDNVKADMEKIYFDL